MHSSSSKEFWHRMVNSTDAGFFNNLDRDSGNQIQEKDFHNISNSSVFEHFTHHNRHNSSGGGANLHSYNSSLDVLMNGKKLQLFKRKESKKKERSHFSPSDLKSPGHSIKSSSSPKRHKNCCLNFKKKRV